MHIIFVNVQSKSRRGWREMSLPVIITYHFEKGTHLMTQKIKVDTSISQRKSTKPTLEQQLNIDLSGQQEQLVRNDSECLGVHAMLEA